MNRNDSSYMYIYRYISICADDEHNVCLLSIAHHMIQVLVQHMNGNRHASLRSAARNVCWIAHGVMMH